MVSACFPSQNIFYSNYRQYSPFSLIVEIFIFTSMSFEHVFKSSKYCLAINKKGHSLDFEYVEEMFILRLIFAIGTNMVLV